MKINKLYSILAGTALVLGLGACDEKVEYTPTPEYTGHNVYFDKDMPSNIAIGVDATSFDVDIYRVGSDSELTVGLIGSITDQDKNPMTQAFSIPTQVTFPKGETQATISIGVNLADIEMEYKYLLDIAINDDEESPYGLNAIAAEVSYSPWSEYEPYGEGEHALVTMSMLVDFDDRPIPVYVSHSLANEKLRYQFGDWDCDDLQPIESAQEDFCNGSNATLIYDPTTGYLTMPPVNLNISVSGSDLYITDVYTYVTEVNPGAAGDIPVENFQPLSGYDEDYGLFYVNTIWYVDGGILGQAYEYFQLPGFKDYYLKFDYYASLCPLGGDEYAEVSAYKSEDVASYCYKMVPGALTNAEALEICNELLDDDEPDLIYDTETTLEFLLHKAGDYTIVAVGFDEAGADVLKTKYTFNFQPVVYYPWESIGVAEYTDGFMYAMYGSLNPMTWDVEVERGTDDPNLIRLVNAYKSENYPYTGEDKDLRGNSYITINIEDPECVYITPSELKIQWSANDGAISVSSLAGNNILAGQDPGRQKRLGYAGKIVDNAITFPGATLLISYSKYNDGEWITTGYDLDVPEDDMAAQLKGTSPFYLDLSTLDMSPKASVPARIYKANKASKVDITKRVPTSKVMYGEKKETIKL